MTRTTKLCILSGGIYIVLVVAIVLVLQHVIPDAEPSLYLCPFCDQPVYKR